ncbi:MAG TPA: glycosyltransferase [Vicinamibacterales bacterium]|nr:glycosyltransferase [Vicinamibacterales bacterium]
MNHIARRPIAFVLTSFEPGGTERQMIELVRRLDRSRWSVHVACFRARGAWFDRVAEAVESVAAFPLDSFKSHGMVRQMWAFARWCRSQNIAVVHTAALPSNVFGLPAAALARVPVRVGNRREINPGKSPAAIALQRAAYSCAHVVVANSRAAADRLRLERVPRRKVTVIANGLDATSVPVRTARPRLRKIVMVANLRAEKGHDVLLDAAVDVLRHVPDARFDLVGTGPDRDSLQARAHARGVAHAVTFAGHCDDVPARLADADLFVLPSRSEAYPNAVLEAMAAGLPIVASSVGGIPELIDDGRNGVLVPAGDSGALAAALCRVISDPFRAERLGAAARLDAARRYSFDRMVAAFEQLYLTELARRGFVPAEPELAAS